MSDSELHEVVIPLDAERCSICGGITVNLEGKPVPCNAHRFCPDCGGTEKGGFDGPQFCPVHQCPAWYDSYTHCRLRRGHDGKHEAWAVHPRFHW